GRCAAPPIAPASSAASPRRPPPAPEPRASSRSSPSPTCRFPRNRQNRPICLFRGISGRKAAAHFCWKCSRRLAKIAAHDKRAAAAAPGMPIVAPAAADLGKAQPPVQRNRRLVGLVDLEEQRLG